MFFMVFIQNQQSSFLLELKISFSTFDPADWPKLHQQTNSKIFSGCLTAKKVFTHNGCSTGKFAKSMNDQMNLSFPKKKISLKNF